MKGFTLIELLVVVLIIGVLTSIALPQYEIVVEKARASEAMINAKAIRDSIDRHDQEFPGDAVTNNSQIADVQLKGGYWFSNTTFMTKKFIYSLEGGNVFHFCRRGSADDCGAYKITYTRDNDGNWSSAETFCDDNYVQVCRLFSFE